jgi:hypothetical protein
MYAPVFSVIDTLKKVRESADSHMNDAFFDGYNTAANICVDVITKNIHELFSQINSGSFLSDQEQFLLLKLNDLKSETEEKLVDFCKGNSN